MLIFMILISEYSAEHVSNAAYALHAQHQGFCGCSCSSRQMSGSCELAQQSVCNPASDPVLLQGCHQQCHATCRA